MSPLLYAFSAYNRFWFELSNVVRWSRPGYVESPVGVLPALDAWQHERIDELKARYDICFESAFGWSVARDNYSYLDMLDRAKRVFGWGFEENRRLLDAGSKNFYYAATLHAFFRPGHLEGIEIDGYTVYQDFHSRSDYARRYIRDLPNVKYRVMDFCAYRGLVDGITCFYPFVKPETLVYWRLPLSVYHPEEFFRQVSRTLKKNGFFFMVNHGWDEGRLAFEMIRRTDLRFVGQIDLNDPLFERTNTPVISLWTKQFEPGE